VTGNTLVADFDYASSTPWYAGIYIAEDIATIADAIENKSWMEGIFGGVAATLDTIGLAIDPLGSLASYGFAWLMEHITPLRQALDFLAGDPVAIRRQAQTWRNISARIAQSASRLHDASVQDLSAWTGPAADQYRAYVEADVKVLRGHQQGAAALATAIEVAGIFIATVRLVVRNLLADFLSFITVRLGEWIIEELITGGLATPLVIAQVATLVGEWVARIANVFESMIRSLRRLGSLMTDIRALLEEAAQLIKKLFRGHGEEPRIPGGEEPPVPKTPAEKLAELRARQAAAAQQKLMEEGIAKVDAEIAAGTRHFTPEELEWLNADPRHKMLAYDPDIKSYRVSEGKDALRVEGSGVLDGPLERSTSGGTDFRDVHGQDWSFKSNGPSSTVETVTSDLVGEALAGRRVVGTLDGMSAADQAAVRAAVAARLDGVPHAEVRFYSPPGGPQAPIGIGGFNPPSNQDNSAGGH
jgi:hypothetical protein